MVGLVFENVCSLNKAKIAAACKTLVSTNNWFASLSSVRGFNLAVTSFALIVSISKTPDHVYLG